MRKFCVENGPWIPFLMIRARLEHFFSPVPPTLPQDIVNAADKRGDDGKAGRIDPFVEIYDVSVYARAVLRPSLLSCSLFFPSTARFSNDRPCGRA